MYCQPKPSARRVLVCRNHIASEWNSMRALFTERRTIQLGSIKIWCKRTVVVKPQVLFSLRFRTIKHLLLGPRSLPSFTHTILLFVCLLSLIMAHKKYCFARPFYQILPHFSSLSLRVSNPRRGVAWR